MSERPASSTLARELRALAGWHVLRAIRLDERQLATRPPGTIWMSWRIPRAQRRAARLLLLAALVEPHPRPDKPTTAQQ